MFRSLLLLCHVCLTLGVRDMRRERINKDCRVASLRLEQNVDFRQYPPFLFHQLNIGNRDDVAMGGVSFITRLTDDTVSTYASARNGTTLECGLDVLAACRNVPAKSSIMRVTTVNIPEPSTVTMWVAAADYKTYMMFYLCLTPLDSEGACPPGQSRLTVETTAEKLSKRIFNLALSVASRLCIDPNQWLNIRDVPTCPKILALRARHEKRKKKMRKQGRGYGHSTW